MEGWKPLFLGEIAVITAGGLESHPGIKVSSLPFFQQVKGTNTMIEDDIYRASSQWHLSWL
jgi:hypothetical protein